MMDISATFKNLYRIIDELMHTKLEASAGLNLASCHSLAVSTPYHSSTSRPLSSSSGLIF